MSTQSNSLVLLLMLVVACGATKPLERQPHGSSAKERARAPAPPPTRPIDLYAADEALRDALAGSWQYVGTGRWPGIDRASACVFRNDRVFLVNAYCTIREQNAIRIDVYSPQRGRVRIYAESAGPVSKATRSDYFTFTAESEPPPGARARLPELSLSMSFDELRAYERQRYDAFLPACYGGQERSEQRNGCLGALASRADGWAHRNRAFLDNASAEWYRLVDKMRELSALYGVELH